MGCKVQVVFFFSIIPCPFARFATRLQQPLRPVSSLGSFRGWEGGPNPDDDDGADDM